MEELTMPYGATVEGDGSWYPKIVGDHPMKKTPVSLGLVPGPCRVSASWDGENTVDVGLTTVEGDKRVASIPAKKQRGGGDWLCHGHHRSQSRRPGVAQRSERAGRNRNHRGLPNAHLAAEAVA